VAEQAHIRHFLVFVFALLIPCFALWTALSALLAVPAIGFVHTALTNWFPDVVHGLHLQGAEGVLLTEFGESNGRLVSLQEAEYRLGFIVNTRIVSYSIPFYTALHFATPKKEYLGSYLWGLLVLYPIFAFGLLSLCLKELMVNLGAAFLDQPDVFIPDANVIGLLYQLNTLIVPTLAPALLWAWQSRETPLFRTAFSAGGEDAGET
jgi:hypothetical protein